jgi:hypothetical protein
MSTFKNIAYQVLQEANKPLHSNEITKIAIEQGLLRTTGKTPEATMNAQLITDVNNNAESRFIKFAPSMFALNGSIVQPVEAPEENQSYKISEKASSRQKGDIVEARISELITLYGDTALSCYKPVSDDEGIDLSVKEKGSLKTIYLQVKSRFGDDPNKIFVANIKASTVVDNYAMGFVFCYFDSNKGNLGDRLWFVPAPDFVEIATKQEKNLSFVAGRKKSEKNKWNNYLIDKTTLANRIISQMKRI